MGSDLPHRAKLSKQIEELFWCDIIAAVNNREYDMVTPSIPTTLVLDRGNDLKFLTNSALQPILALAMCLCIVDPWGSLPIHFRS